MIFDRSTVCGWVVVLSMLPAMALAECVLRSTTVTESIAVSEKSQVTANVVTTQSGDRKCLVSFNARVNGTWHMAFGEAEWDGRGSPDSSCASAIKNAERDLVRSLAPLSLRAEDVMICDDSSQQRILSIAVGMQGPIHQFRPHTTKQGEFWYNGTRCRWVLDTQFVSSKLHTYEGIICRVGGDEWVVVDTF